MNTTIPEAKGSLAKDFLLPSLIWIGTIIVFLNVKNIPLELSTKDNVVLRYLVKVVVTILVPLAVIHLLYKKKGDFGIYFQDYSDSFKLTFRAFSVVGPACMSFLLIGILGWGFGDWPGGIVLSIAFLTAFYFVPRATDALPTRNDLGTPNKRINTVVWLSILTVIVAYFTYGIVPVGSKILYYLFIVGFGEELLFRGYLQSAFNRYFGKPFSIKGVKFGWGLFLAAALFGLSHAIVTVPPTWPWAIWTGIFALTLGFIREKDGSILAAVMLHGLADLPLAFISA